MEDDLKFEQVARRESQRKLAIEEAVNYIGEILGRTDIKGFNDYEIPYLNDLKNKVESGDLAPAKGKKLADEVLAGKMDYH